MPAARYPAFSTPASRARSTRRVERPPQSAAATAPVDQFLGSSPSEHLTDELEGQGFDQPIMGSHGAISRANFLSRPAATRSHYQDRGPGYCRLRHQSGHCHSSRAFCAGPCQVRKPRRCPPDTMQRHRSDPQEHRALNSGYCPCRFIAEQSLLAVVARAGIQTASSSRWGKTREFPCSGK